MNVIKLERAKYLVFILLFIVTGATAQNADSVQLNEDVQEGPPSRPSSDDLNEIYVSLFGEATFPQNVFKKSGYGNGYGLGFAITAGVSEKYPVYVGLGFSYEWVRSRYIEYDLYNGASQILHYKDYARTAMWRLMASTKYFTKFKLGGQPYIEAVTGLKFMNSTIETYEDDDFAERTKERGSVAWDVGLGLGYMYRIYRNLVIDVSCDYLAGTSAKYHTPKPGPVNHQAQYPFDNYELKRSATDNIYLKIGVSVLLN